MWQKTNNLEAQQMTLVPVYDILSCGPRRRFSANGKLVHNSDKVNAQNIPKREQVPAGAPIKFGLRDGLVAPKGKLVVAADLSNIELRLALAMCRQHDKLALIRNGADLYCDFAGKLYNQPVTKADIVPRKVGKAGVLSCQYGTGGATFQNMLFTQAGVIEDLEFCTRTVKTYRSDFDKVSGAWKELDRQIIAMAAGQLRTPEIDGPMIWKTDRVIMPSGFALKYPQIRPSSTERGYCFLRRSHKNAARGGFDTIWGGSFLENLCQSLAAQVIMYYAKVVFDLTGIRPCHQVHDELIWMIDEKDAENFRRVALHVMHQAPVWWPELDLAAEASKPAVSYGAS
jgi:DNA polymerase family A